MVGPKKMGREREARSEEGAKQVEEKLSSRIDGGEERINGHFQFPFSFLFLFLFFSFFFSNFKLLVPFPFMCAWWNDIVTTSRNCEYPTRVGRTEGQRQGERKGAESSGKRWCVCDTGKKIWLGSHVQKRKKTGNAETLAKEDRRRGKRSRYLLSLLHPYAPLIFPDFIWKFVQKRPLPSAIHSKRSPSFPKSRPKSLIPTRK